MHWRNIILWISCFLISIQLFGQHQELTQKYWSYRSRMLGLFGEVPYIIPGKQAGESIPVSGINFIADCTQDGLLLHMQCPTNKGKGFWHVSDGTIYLAHYTGLLTTELYLLKSRKNIFYQDTYHELLLALDALLRLDSMAEISVGMPGEINGFFLRDDAQVDFMIQKYKSRSHRTPGKECNCMISDFGCGDINRVGGRFTSLDQITPWFMVCRLLVTLFPEDVVLQSKARNIIQNIYFYLTSHGWMIKHPDGRQIPNNWGGDTRAMSDLIERGYLMICNRSALPWKRDLFAFALGRLITEITDLGFGFQPTWNQSMFFELAIASDAWNSEDLESRAIDKQKELYLFINAIIQNEIPRYKKLKEHSIEILQSAPEQGPGIGEGQPNTPGWMAPDRWWKTSFMSRNPYNDNKAFIGIDYMFFYNLFCILYPKEGIFYSMEGAKSFFPARGQLLRNQSKKMF